MLQRHHFSKTSTGRLSSCHIDLQTIMNAAIAISNIDFGIAEGHRSIEDQQKDFKEGKSKIDGIKIIGKHNLTPSMAVDIYAWALGKPSYSFVDLSYLSGLIYAVAEQLFAFRIISHRIRWGGNWDMDGVILIDQAFDDAPHYELVNL